MSFKPCSGLGKLLTERWVKPAWAAMRLAPIPRTGGKKGVKRSLLVEGDGGPLSIAVAAANVHDTKVLGETLDAIVVERPKVTQKAPQNLCLDKAYENPTGRKAILEHGYQAHICQIGKEKLDHKERKRYPARRWVVERTLGWLSKCRAILVRYDKKSENYLGLLQLACSLIWYRRACSVGVLG
jgi:putative transposase